MKAQPWHSWLLTATEQIRFNGRVARFPLSWQGRLRRMLGKPKNRGELERWDEMLDRLMASERGGLRPDASDLDICEQADLTVRDIEGRLRDVHAVWVGRGVVDAYGGSFLEAMQALAVREVLTARGLDDLWPGGLSSDPEACGWGRQRKRSAWLRRAVCPRFWRRVYRRLHARTVEAVAVSIGLVRKTAGLYCSDDALHSSRAADLRNARVLDGVVAVNEGLQDYTLAELAAKGVANQEIRRHELLTRIAGFELIAKECGHIAFMVTVTCPSRFHAATTRQDGRVVDNPKYAHLTPRDGQEYLSQQWARARTAGRAKKRGKLSEQWYGFRIAEPQHDGTPHWHLLIFMPREVAGLQASAVMRELFLAYFLENDSPDERGAVEYRVDFEEIDWAKGSAVGYVIKYVSKNIDGHGVDYDLYGEPAIASSQRVRAWARKWSIRQFQQIGGAPVTVWRELRRVHPDAVPAGAPEALRACMSAMNVAKVEPGVQALAWAKFTKAMGGIDTARDDMAIKLIEGKAGESRYGDETKGRPVGVFAWGVELFRNHIHEMNPRAPEFERRVLLEVESERSQWLIGGSTRAAAVAVAASVFERIGEAERTRIHVNNCTGAALLAPPRSPFLPVRRRVKKLRRYGWAEPRRAGRPAFKGVGMRAFNTWNQVQVVNEKLEAVGRCGVVGDTKGHKDDAVPVKLDGDDSETVFKNADLKAL